MYSLHVVNIFAEDQILQESFFKKLSWAPEILQGWFSNL